MDFTQNIKTKCKNSPQENLNPTMPELFDNRPKAESEYSHIADILNQKIDKDKLSAIGVVANYGAGKSSAIQTYLDKYRNSRCGFFKNLKYLWRFKCRRNQKKKDSSTYTKISLASFNEFKYEDTDIERSVLQQLIYSRPKNKFPNSKIERTTSTSKWTILLSILIVALISSCVFLGLKFSGSQLFPSDAWIAWFLIAIVLLMSLILIWIVLHYKKLHKIKYKDFEIEIVKNYNEPSNRYTHQSLINKFVDEILYFFERTNIDLVIFEDIDRLCGPTSIEHNDKNKNIPIFVKLKELNTIINNRAKCARKVTFLYAVKNDLFTNSEERSKFFEFILPIAPTLSPERAAPKINMIQKEKFSKIEKWILDNEFVHQISIYIQDMRILKNTFNDYIIFKWKHRSSVLSQNNEHLFSLCLYKNLYPQDYALLERGKGLVTIILDKNKLIDKANREHSINDNVEKNRFECLKTKKFMELFGVQFFFPDENNSEIYEKYGEQLANLGLISQKENISSIYKNPEQIDFIKFLLINDYINEDYIEYLGLHIESSDDKDLEYLKKIRAMKQCFEYTPENWATLEPHLVNADFEKYSIISNWLLNNMDKISCEKRKEKLISLLNSDKKEVTDSIVEFVKQNDDKLISKFFKQVIKNEIKHFIPLIIDDQIDLNSRDLILSILIERNNFDWEDFFQVREFLNASLDYTKIFESTNIAKIEDLLCSVNPCFSKLVDVNDPITGFIIEKNFFAINLENLHIIFADEKYRQEFKKANYGLISKNENLKKYIDENISDYIEEVFLSDELSGTGESVETIIEFLKSENSKITIEKKKKIIEKYSFILKDITVCKEIFSDDLLRFDRVETSWENILTIFSSLGLTEALVEFIFRNLEKLVNFSFEGDTSSVKFLNLCTAMINRSYKEDDLVLFTSFIRRIENDRLSLNNDLKNDKNLKIVIALKKVKYSTNDYSYLKECPEALCQYIEIYCENILRDLNSFFSGLTTEHLNRLLDLKMPKQIKEKLLKQYF